MRHLKYEGINGFIQKSTTNQEEKHEQYIRKMGKGYEWVFNGYRQGTAYVSETFNINCDGERNTAWGHNEMQFYIHQLEKRRSLMISSAIADGPRGHSYLGK